MNTKAVTVFCASQPGNKPIFTAHARQLGEMLTACGCEIIYGGGGKGLMGELANGALQSGGTVTGIIPKRLMDFEHHHKSLSRLIVTEDMHERKKQLYEIGDAAIVLAGGFGTLDEFFEMLTWNQLSIHDKKIYLLNTDGYYDHLLQHIHQMERGGFLYDSPSNRIKVCNTPAEVINALD
jgi:uncharacterized protein (TIGR00730 family)